MSKDVLDKLIIQAVSDEEFRLKLTHPDSFHEAVKDFDLTPEEIKHLKRVVLERSSTGFPFAAGLSERLSK